MEWLRKTGDESQDEIVPVTIEPKPGFTDESVIEVLKDLGIEVQHIAAGFLSSRVPRSLFSPIERCAYIHPKAKKTLK